MVFSSHIFLFAFLPAFLACYFLAPARFRNGIILLFSWVFYGWWRLDFLLLMIAVIAWCFVVGQRLAASEGAARKRWLALGVAGCLAVLGYFKYFNFGVEALSDAYAAIGGAPFTLWHVILPIGISFYVFQSISYLIDVHRGDAPAARDFLSFGAFISLFPQLIAGPILRYKDLVDQFESRTHSWVLFGEGAHRFAIGFCKKVLIADTVAPIADYAFALPDPSFATSWLGALAYAIQLYFDFSGYSDMAIGLGMMLGFRLLENFRQPYVSSSITEFWRRWHISLSNWLRDYLYIPLGGNRRGRVRTYVNLLLTMLLGGAWHGANWTFVVWGAWHGSLLALERLALGRGRRNPYGLIGWPLTMLLVLIGWVMFRAPTLAEAFAVYRGMVGANGFATEFDLWLETDRLMYATLTLGLVLVAAPRLLRVEARPPAWLPAGRVAMRWAMMPLFVLAVLKLTAASYSPFLYFQF
ncbi:MAG: MBOAT family protein [Alphaproteobacteria bacterium]